MNSYTQNPKTGRCYESPCFEIIEITPEAGVCVSANTPDSAGNGYEAHNDLGAI